MKTRYLKVNSKKPEKSKIQFAAEILKGGGLVAFPTETVYGLGADALSPEALKKIFRAKGRPSDNPLIVHIAAKKDIFKYASYVPLTAKKLIRKFWPGPLTIVLRKKKIIPKEISAGLRTVALRQPKNKTARALIRAAGFPLAAPSANVSGRPSPTEAGHVLRDLRNKIDCVLDGGPTQVGLESTVIDLSGKNPVLLRPGKITLEQLLKIVPNVVVYSAARTGDEKKIKVHSPGMKYRHYAPLAELWIVEGDLKRVRKKIQSLADALKGKKSVVVLTLSRKKLYPHTAVRYIGSTAPVIAMNLFRVLRVLDERKTDVIIAEGVADKGLGRAIMNRLRKAAGSNIIKV